MMENRKNPWDLVHNSYRSPDLVHWDEKVGGSRDKREMIDTILLNFSFAPIYYQEVQIREFPAAMRTAIAMASGVQGMDGSKVQLLCLRTKTKLTRPEFRKMPGDCDSMVMRPEDRKYLETTIPSVQIAARVTPNGAGSRVIEIAKNYEKALGENGILKTLIEDRLKHLGIRVKPFESGIG